MRCMKKLLLCVTATLALAGAKAQDINFSQFYELPLLRNPALAGYFRGDLKATGAFRNQWGSVTTPFRTMALGTEMRFGLGGSENYLTLGTQITNDVAGDSKLSRTQLLPALTFHKSLNEDRDAYLSAGFIGGFVQQRYDAAALTFSDQFVNGAYSPTNPTRQRLPSSNVTYLDAGAGIAYSSTMGYDVRYYAGAAIFHFNQPKVAFDAANDVRLNQKFFVNAGLSAPVADRNRVVLYGDFFMQGGHHQAQGGVLYRHFMVEEDDDYGVSFSFGGFYRWNDAVVPVVKLDYYKLSFGLTYDVNVSKLVKASQMRGGFELTMTYSSFLNIRSSSANKVRCPVAL
ncbi:type IX secretion system membrane protein PorP/SprF [Flaviaesturariibacter aridisoli]|uniref:Type IX secretion system membrane protein PorP/SprF n=2 Tax=Flaviaesturariibacter aridisoli TaxID=2545761 RepID=A0A4R4EAL2_9BACT|nr:type IX secretion system membrane protein PorP/SprF [Flaviaesturariibacter aridisoli]